MESLQSLDLSNCGSGVYGTIAPVFSSAQDLDELYLSNNSVRYALCARCAPAAAKKLLHALCFERLEPRRCSEWRGRCHLLLLFTPPLGFILISTSFVYIYVCAFVFTRVCVCVCVCR